MIVINCALMQNEIISFVEAYHESIHFEKKAGIGLQFSSDDEKTLAPEIKKALKADPRFKALFFNVEVK
ncbi:MULTISPECIES: hypothetical protein [Bacillota]|jgi:hypothetical protein|uniref:Uncharacterized protein n=1 Tax=Amedibacillus hominis TaxID=2897776 RepID=A0ABS9R5P4_9FIRM|nr:MULTISPECIES: hypothetical protein [Bacillota]MCH4284981.1 hypothetical protein [Amedibacillus hominis]RGB55202.1 hypothetical protein DW271_09545 [Absiella sp. AM22-9]RGB62831.1 hypothetical protein DW120_02945 [Absiella sp. AM10-20]RGB63046.1 hypothetical protein DW113_18620 [Absiella sp. AM09-45]RGB72240.1 hypothetical protein DW114_18675 [Absiella sp. AM09-50]